MTGELRGVTSEMLEPYTGLVARVARGYKGVRGAEYDDLFQEAMIAVARSIAKGIHRESVLADRSATACRDWVRHVSRGGLTGYHQEEIPGEL